MTHLVVAVVAASRKRTRRQRRVSIKPSTWFWLTEMIQVQCHRLPLTVVWVVVSNIFYFHPYLGKWSNLTNIFQRGWNHQLVVFCVTLTPMRCLNDSMMRHLKEHFLNFSKPFEHLGFWGCFLKIHSDIFKFRVILFFWRKQLLRFESSKNKNRYQTSTRRFTPQKSNIETTNGCVWKESPFASHHFRYPAVSFRGCMPFSWVCPPDAQDDLVGKWKVDLGNPPKNEITGGSSQGRMLQ